MHLFTPSTDVRHGVGSGSGGAKGIKKCGVKSHLPLAGTIHIETPFGVPLS